MKFWTALRLVSAIVFVILVIAALLFAGYESRGGDADTHAAPTVIR